MLSTVSAIVQTTSRFGGRSESRQDREERPLEKLQEKPA